MSLTFFWSLSLQFGSWIFINNNVHNWLKKLKIMGHQFHTMDFVIRDTPLSSESDS